MLIIQAGSATAVKKFDRNMQELKALLAFHTQVSQHPLPNPATGDYYDANILIKHGIVFLVTCWEDYIKSLLEEAFSFILARANTPDMFPKNVQMSAAELLPQESKFSTEVWHRSDEWKKDIWRLTTEWQQLLTKHQTAKVSKSQSPRPEAVDELFYQILGMKHLSQSWFWPTMTTENVKLCLNTLIDLRGDLVHKNVSYRPVEIADIDYFSLFVNQLAGISGNTVRNYIYARTTEFPWSENEVFDLTSTFDPRRCTLR